MERVDNQQTHNPYPGYIGCEDHLSPAPEMADRSWRWYQPHLSSSYTSSYAGPVWAGHEHPSFINNVKTYSTAVNIMSILEHCIILFCQEFWIEANLFSKLSVACVQNCQKYEFLSLNKQINYFSFSSKHVPLLQLCSNPSGCVKCIGCHHHQILSTKAELLCIVLSCEATLTQNTHS